VPVAVTREDLGMNVNRIVVGVDFGEPSIAAVRWTARRFGSGAELVLVHALYMPEPPDFLRGLFPSSAALMEDARRGAEDRLRELRDTLDAASVEVETGVGRPDEVLLRAAADRQADLIVVGPHDERPGVWKLLGSTAERVVRGGGRAVLLARQIPQAGPQRVLLAIDESPARHEVFAWGARLAAETGARLFVINIVNALAHRAVSMGASPKERDRAETQMRERAMGWVEEEARAAGMADAGLNVAFGDAGFEILAAIPRLQADLVVVGRHGAGGTSGAFMGSVPEFLLRNGTISVLTVGGLG
jgi:nucleotide-binding universal stress UspA family protein